MCYNLENANVIVLRLSIFLTSIGGIYKINTVTDIRTSVKTVIKVLGREMLKRNRNSIIRLTNIDQNTVQI